MTGAKGGLSRQGKGSLFSVDVGWMESRAFKGRQTTLSTKVSSGVPNG